MTHLACQQPLHAALLRLPAALEESDHLVVPVARRQHEWRAADEVARGWVRAVIEQQPGGPQVPSGRSHMKRRPSQDVRGSDIGPVRNEPVC